MRARTVAQIGKWSDAVREAAQSCTPQSVKVRSREAMIRSSRATGRRAWKLFPVSAIGSAGEIAQAPRLPRSIR